STDARQNASSRPLNLRETCYGLRKRVRFVEREIGRRFGGMLDGIAILDVGCGTGGLLSVPLALLGLRVHGIDLDSRSIEAATETVHRLGLANATFAHSDVTAIDTETFDAALCSEVLEHIPDYPRHLRLVVERVKPGGLVIVTVPNGHGP